MKKELKRMIRVFVSVCILFVSLIVYLSYFQIADAKDIKNNSYNKRLWIDEESILRGMILDRNGKILAYSKKTGEEEIAKRYYNYGSLYSHIIGYSYREYGKSGLEATYNNELLNLKDNAALNEIQKMIKPNGEGNSIKLTVDHHIQEYAKSLLKGKKGSVIVMNPKTGEIYAMVSLPDFDVSTLRENWKTIVENPDSPFLNRATMGLYEPGSTFKVLTSIAALENFDEDKVIDCKGSVKIDGYTFKDYNGKGHGRVDLQEALVESCNVYFTQIGVEIGKNKLGEVAEDFFINKSIPFDLSVKKSSFPFRENISTTELAASSIGQGKVRVTPLNMVMIASGIANGGNIVKPTLVKEVISPEGKVIKSIEPQILSQGVDGFTANKVKNMMVEVVKRGTGTRAQIKNMRVAGKTGTAENSTGKTHSWFIGFAPADDAKVAVVVLLESDGSTGGKNAAPIAQKLMVETMNTIN
ncbi:MULTISPECIES: peptidoglycan D,D-transpeptidase FtsI family protein [Tissierellales]|jgi:peptidoglycan glycosyltransferase|uniref:Beta-lactamase n=1 Tax=Acidilutibacter cellobiosedens TaxID=2507161 RepID=A0A410QEA6_9FIRM|nr:MULTISPECIES: penicillin-binding transpeptidase domain-containing protein [Tissierellales]QAT62320.1 penicillin-binding protein A [Acidilutibacter cellobiosedens]SCL92112.1 Penicillin-binding protein A [Sporanaerobacter sp. PP17-6a]